MPPKKQYEEATTLGGGTGAPGRRVCSFRGRGGGGAGGLASVASRGFLRRRREKFWDFCLSKGKFDENLCNSKL